MSISQTLIEVWENIRQQRGRNRWKFCQRKNSAPLDLVVAEGQEPRWSPNGSKNSSLRSLPPLALQR